MKKIILILVAVYFLPGMSLAESDFKKIDSLKNGYLDTLKKVSELAMHDYWSHRGQVKAYRFQATENLKGLAEEVALTVAQNGNKIERIQEVKGLDLENITKAIDTLGSYPEACHTPEKQVTTDCIFRTVMIVLIHDASAGGCLKLFTGYFNADHATEDFLVVIDVSSGELIVMNSLYDS